MQALSKVEVRTGSLMKGASGEGQEQGCAVSDRQPCET